MSAPLIAPRDWQQISEHLDRALDLEPHARQRWIEELATTQPQLAHWLRKLLAERDAANAVGFLESSPYTSGTLAALEHASLAGQQVGSYTLERLLGRGGMGEVWLASRSDGHFEGQCAIKILSGSAAQPNLVERFRHEAKLLARLAHPNIARLHDAGITSEGHLFLVLEYIDGVRIDQYCEAHALSVSARVRLFLDVIAAVAHAHSQLIIHRDLKPSNVLVTRDGQVKLLDFGVAKLLSPEGVASADPITRVEDVALTPEYAAPEQLLGESPSTATDVYQLGMLLYVLLAGRHPIQLTGSRAKCIEAALNGHIARLSEFAREPLRAKLRGDLDAILALALRKESAERYATAAALHEDLMRYLSGQAVQARRGAALYHARKFVARHRISVIGAAIALASLCGISIVAITQAQIAGAERDRAVTLASRNAAVTQFMNLLITEAAESEQPVTVSEMLDRSEQLAMTDASGNPENRAAVFAMIAGQYNNQGDHVRSAKLLDRALQLIRDSSEHALRSRLICAHAFSISGLGRHEEAVRNIENELRHLDSNPETAAYCMLNRSYIAADDDDAEPAFRYATQGLDRFRAAASPTFAADEGLFLGAVATGHHLNGRNREADNYFRLALQRYVSLGRERSSDAITLRNNWAVVLSGAGVSKRALELYDETLDIFTRRYPRRPLPHYLVGNRAVSLEYVGRFREARAAYELQLQIGNAQQNLTARAHALMGLASTAREMGDRIAARGYLEEFVALLRPSIPPDAPPWMSAAIIQGRLNLDAGQFAAAHAEFVRAIGTKTGSATPLGALLGKAEAELRMGDAATAAADARRALDIAISAQGNLPYSRATGLASLTLGRALQALGDDTGAHQAFETALAHLTNTVDADHPAMKQARESLQATAAAPSSRG